MLRYFYLYIPYQLWLLFLGPWVLHGQSYLEATSRRLDSMGLAIPGLEERTTLSLQKVPMHAYIRAIGREHQINLFIEDRPGLIMTSNLVNEPVKSVFLFICKHFGYDIYPVGTILHFVPFAVLPDSPPLNAPLNVAYQEGLLSLDLQQDSLFAVIREISRLTHHKIITTPGSNRPISVFVPPSEVDLALDLLAEATGFHLQKNKKGYYVLRDLQGKEPLSRKGLDFSIETFTDADQMLISLKGESLTLSHLIKSLFAQTETDYLLFGNIQGSISIHLEAARLEDVLQYLFQGTNYTYRRDGKLFLIGEKGLPGLQSIHIVKLKYRPTNQALQLIPDIQGESATASRRQEAPHQGNTSLHFAPRIASRRKIGEVILIEYPELNRIILKGPTEGVEELVNFLREIDRPIPMVKIEMIVVEVSKNVSLNTGVKAGLGKPDSLKKAIAPALDYTLNGKEINSVLGASQLPFLQSIGNLSPDFYVQLQAEEERGNLEIRMRPVLSMLNGREASLTIGQTQYFLLKTTNASTGAGNNFQQFTEQFTQIEANVTLHMRPFVSDDHMVTLDLSPDFSTPIGNFNARVPPTIATRKFDSSIRVKDGETFILGGLTREERSRSSRGLPWISRVPILKWFFGSNTRKQSDTSLMIYITPTIYYH